MHLVAFWMFVIICSREVIITCWRLWMIQKGEILPAERAGKYKTVAQIVAISFILIFVIFKESQFTLFWPKEILLGWQYGIYILMYIAVGFTLISGFLYLWNNRRLLYVR